MRLVAGIALLFVSHILIAGSVSGDAKALLARLHDKAGDSLTMTITSSDCRQRFVAGRADQNLIISSLESPNLGQASILLALGKTLNRWSMAGADARASETFVDLTTVLAIPFCKGIELAALGEISVQEQTVGNKRHTVLRIIPEQGSYREIRAVYGPESLRLIAVGVSERGFSHYYQGFGYRHLGTFEYPTSLESVEPGNVGVQVLCEPANATLMKSLAGHRNAVRSSQWQAFSKAVAAADSKTILATGRALATQSTADAAYRVLVQALLLDPSLALDVVNEWMRKGGSRCAQLHKGSLLARQGVMLEAEAQLKPLLEDADPMYRVLAASRMMDVWDGRSKGSQIQLLADRLARDVQIPFSARIDAFEKQFASLKQMKEPIPNAHPFRTLVSINLDEIVDTILGDLRKHPSHTAHFARLKRKLRFQNIVQRKRNLEELVKMYPLSMMLRELQIPKSATAAAKAIAELRKAAPDDQFLKEAIMRAEPSQARILGPQVFGYYKHGPNVFWRRLQMVPENGQDALVVFEAEWAKAQHPEAALVLAGPFAQQIAKLGKGNDYLQKQATGNPRDQLLAAFAGIAVKENINKILAAPVPDAWVPALLEIYVERSESAEDVGNVYDLVLGKYPYHLRELGVSLARKWSRAEGKDKGKALAAILAYGKIAVDKGKAYSEAIRYAYSLGVERKDLIPLYRNAIDQAPAKYALRWTQSLARVQMKNGLHAEAEQTLLRVFAVEPVHSYYEEGAAAMLRDLYRERKILDERIAEFGASMKKDFDVAKVRFLAYHLQYQKRDYRQSAEVLQELVKRAPLRIYHDRLFLAYRFSRQVGAAVELLDRMKRLYPEDAATLDFKQLDLMLGMGMMAKAGALVGELVKREHSIQDWMKIAVYYRQTGDYEAAMGCYDRILERASREQRESIIIKKAEVMLAAGQKDRAIIALRRLQLRVAGRFNRSQVNRMLRELRETYKGDAFKPLPAHILGLKAVPVPKKVTVDGKLDDWDLSGLRLACEDVNLRLNQYSAKIATMYDKEGLYVAVQVTDETPLQNWIDPAGRENPAGHRGDCVQIRFRFADKTCNLDSWYVNTMKKAVCYFQTGSSMESPIGGSRRKLLYAAGPDMGEGFLCGFSINEDKRGYVQELRIPWTYLTGEAPKAGDRFQALFQINWGRNAQAHTLASNTRPGAQNKRPTQLWRSTADYGTIELSPKGNLKLRPQKWELMQRASSARLSTRFRKHTGEIRALAQSSGSPYLLSASMDQTVCAWNVEEKKLVAQFKGHTKSVYGVAITHDGKIAASGGGDRAIQLWSTSDAKPIRALNGHRKTVWSLAFSPDGKTLASAAMDKTVRLWDVATGKELRVLTGEKGFRTITFSPNGKRIAAGSLDRHLHVWETATGKQVGRWAGHEYAIRQVNYSPNGKLIASASDDMSIQVRDAATGKLLHKFEGHSSLATTVIFIDDRRIISGSQDGSVRLWDLEGGIEVKRMVQDDPGIWALAIDPRTHIAAYAGRDHSIRFLRYPE